MSKYQVSKYAFLDLETGGLNGRIDNGELGICYYPIFEIALIVTDSNLNQVGDEIRIVVHQNEEMINRSHEWAINTHTKSGLLAEVRESGISLAQAEQIIIEHFKELGIQKYERKTGEGAILAGSSVSFDRGFMMAQMPALNEYIHYRQLDVSALNIASGMFKPSVTELIKKELKHEALADIRETIAELKVYQEQLFK